MRRCFVCEADLLEPTDRHIVHEDGRRRAFPFACASCGVLVQDGADPAACWADLARGLAGRAFRLDPQAPYGLDIYTLRLAATRLRRGVRAVREADRAALLHPHSERAAAGDLFDLNAGRPATVSLGLLCRPQDLEAVLAGLPAHAAWTNDVAILVDAPDGPPSAAPIRGYPSGAVRIAARPLADDFAAQRNALQDLSRRAWMLQLDADEALAPAVGELLPALAALAEEGDVLSIGLPRRNRVDGVLSDVYPDVQYRLNRMHVRFRGRVHERPDLGGEWRRGFITLHGAIEHRLSRAHVEARSRRYEAMDPGRGRPEEETALLRPYRP
ncbi:hypothetical protein [Methylobacterium sp. E-045]|uniref:hypothetical protein n=1 Tax=Methylobacterium sp. E-045 TaxID=2836575 RepID=UPI001FB8837E|nr:hypothetical protein [Methylobacterium sp. E-045]MCJ2132223.1 hypothetical protein [Methylobacterium sp. E-045]